MATPITRDNIYYYSGNTTHHGEVKDSDDCFYVKIEHNRHARASPDHLYRLLTGRRPPHIILSSTASTWKPLPRNDEAAHFYTAQLYHYGLKPLKTKAAAKKALLAAFGDGYTLAIPERIINLRKELYAEWLVAHNKAMAEEADRKAEEARTFEKKRVESRRMLEQFAAEEELVHKSSQKSAKVRFRLDVFFFLHSNLMCYQISLTTSRLLAASLSMHLD